MKSLDDARQSRTSYVVDDICSLSTYGTLFLSRQEKHSYRTATLYTMAFQFVQYIFQRSLIIVFDTRSKTYKKSSQIQIQMNKIENEHTVLRGKQ